MIIITQYQRQVQAQLAKPPVSHTPRQAKQAPHVQSADKKPTDKPQDKTGETTEEMVVEVGKEKAEEDNKDVEMKDNGQKQEEESD